MLATPYTEDLVGPGNTEQSSDSGFKVSRVCVCCGCEQRTCPRAGAKKRQRGRGLEARGGWHVAAYQPSSPSRRSTHSPTLCPPHTQGWIIAVIVGVVLIVVPVPAYLLVRWRKRKNKEAAAIQVGSGAAVALVSWLIHAVSCQAQGNEAAAIQMALVLD